MINSRALSDLLPPVQLRAREFLALCRQALEPSGVQVIVTSTYRDHASQNALFAQGRTRPGKIVTNARGGESWHNFRCAFDIALLNNGKNTDPKDDVLIWDNTAPNVKLWQAVGQLGELAGLEWAGRWVRFREMAHFQYTGGLTLDQLRAGAKVV